MRDYSLSDDEIQRVQSLPFTLPEKLRQILDGFKWAVRFKKTSAVMLIDGRSGMGKTTLAFQIATYSDPDFSLARVYFNPEQFLNGLSEAPAGSVHVFDEAMIVSNRSAMSIINRTIIQAMSMIRSKRIIVIFCINSIFDMDRNIVLSRGDILLNVYGESLTDRGTFMAFFKGEDGMDRLKLLYLHGKKFYDYSKPKSNFNARFGSYFPFDENEYERQKQEGVNSFLRSNDKYTSEKAKIVRDKLILWIMKNHPELKQEEVADIAGITRMTITNIRREYNLIGS